MAQGSLSRDFKRPLLVDENFLRKLDEVLEQNVEIAAQVSAENNNLNAETILEIVKGKKLADDTDKPIYYSSAVKDCQIRYTVLWRNDFSAEFSDIESCLKALRLEGSEPRRITARLGNYLFGLCEIIIAPIGDRTVKIEGRGSLQKLKIAIDPIINLLRISTPDFHILHNIYFKGLLIFCLFMLFFAETFYMGGKSATTQDGLHPFFGFALLLLFTGLGFLVAAQYARTFPSVVFDFGSGAKQKVRMRLFFAVLTLFLSIVIPAALA